MRFALVLVALVLVALVSVGCDPVPEEEEPGSETLDPVLLPASAGSCSPVLVLPLGVVYCESPPMSYDAAEIEVYDSGVIVFSADDGVHAVVGDCYVEDE